MSDDIRMGALAIDLWHGWRVLRRCALSIQFLHLFWGVDRGHNLLVLLHHCPQSSRARANAIVKIFRAVTLVRSTAQSGCPWSGVPACMAWWHFCRTMPYRILLQDNVW